MTPLALFVVTSVLRLIGLMSRPFGLGDLTGLILCVALALWFLFIVNQRMILREDAIEVQTWFSNRELTRDEILGWRGVSYRGYSYVIVPRDPLRRNLRLSPHLPL